MLDDAKVLKRFRVITQNRNQKINGMKRGEEFEALWPDEWLERRIKTHHIEMLADPEPEVMELQELTEEV